MTDQEKIDELLLTLPMTLAFMERGDVERLGDNELRRAEKAFREFHDLIETVAIERFNRKDEEKDRV